MEKQRYYISTAIAYTSGKPHIGNTYEVVLADAIARFKRLVGLSAGFCYLIAGISVVTEVLSIGFGISTDWTMKSTIITTVVFVLLPHIGMGIVAVIEVVKCGLQDFIFG